MRNQYSRETCEKLSNLYLQWGCIPFDQMPYATSLIKHNPRIYDLFDCINSENREHEFLARTIQNNTEQRGVLQRDKEQKSFSDTQRGLVFDEGLEIEEDRDDKKNKADKRRNGNIDKKRAFGISLETR